MFLLVRAGYELVESSTRLYRSSILPSSAFRPLGTYPPCSSPCSIAKSSPARSAPVLPPDMVFRSISKQRNFCDPIRTTPPQDRLPSALPLGQPFHQSSSAIFWLGFPHFVDWTPVQF